MFFFCLIKEVFLIPHLISSASAAGFGIARDAEINACLLEYLCGGFGQLLHSSIVAGKTANVVEDVYRFPGGVFQIQTGCPIAPLAGGGYHGSMFPQTGNCIVKRGIGLAILDALNSEFLYRFQHFHVHGVVAGDATCAAELAVVNDIKQLVGIVKPVPQHGSSDIQPAAA